MSKNKMKRVVMISGIGIISLITILITLILQKDGVLVGNIGKMLALSDVISIFVFLLFSNWMINLFYKSDV
jgi:hypothetical protein